MLRLLPVGSFACALCCCAPAFAANQTVTATPMDQFMPASVTIAQGETVTWNNGGGSHNVRFRDGGFTMPSSPNATAWSVPRTFAAPGTFDYACDAHAPGMSGTVVVTAGGTPPPPGGGPPAPNDPHPVSSLSTAARQDVDRLIVRASMNEAGTLTATGTVNLPGRAAKVLRFRPASKPVAAGVVAKLRLKLKKKPLRAVKRALRIRRLRAKVTVTAKDNAGQTTVRQRTIRLTR